MNLHNIKHQAYPSEKLLHTTSDMNMFKLDKTLLHNQVTNMKLQLKYENTEMNKNKTTTYVNLRNVGGGN